jgi:hypothetical protein
MIDAVVAALWFFGTRGKGFFSPSSKSFGIV